MIRIETTGLEQYAPGGTARVQAMFIGGPGAGKTRLSSYFPAPIYANVENGLASVADRSVPFATINNSKDMLEFIELLERECRLPVAQRRWETVVIDTLDTYQRKLKNEWLLAHPGAAAFSGYDAWGFLDSKMQLLMTRLLNLDMHVLVLVHYSDKTYTEGTGDNKTERHELVLQLSGAMKDQAFNDFDLVGWLGTFWEADENGQRVQKRGLTFKPTPDKPFLKDRLNVTPTFLEVTFSEDDYNRLFAAVLSRLDDLPESTLVAEIEAESDGEIVAPGTVEGPVEGRGQASEDLNDWKKPELVAEAKRLGLTFPGNILKGELIVLLEQARAAEAAPEVVEPQSGDPDTSNEAEPVPDTSFEANAPEATEQHADEAVEQDQAEARADEVEAAVEAAAEAIVEGLDATEVSTEPVEGEEVVDLTPQEQPAEEPSPEPEPEVATTVEAEAEVTAPTGGPVCADCGKDVAKDSFAQLALIKFKVPLCEQDYRSRRSA